jgi:hypothetical protein
LASEKVKMRARHPTVAAAALLLLIGAGQTLGAEPTAAGLWQSLDEESHQPNAWFLIRDNGGLYEGTIGVQGNCRAGRRDLP